MRAVRLEEIGRLTLVELPETPPGPAEILVETIATGICGSDIHGYTGDNGRRHPGQVMGHETVGRIAALGAGVDADRFPVGSLVTVNPVIVPEDGSSDFEGREQHHPHRQVLGVDPEIVSAFAERYAVPASNVVVLPEMTNPLHAALIEPLAVAMHAVNRIGVKPGLAVLVLGGGPIGQSCVLAAQRAGARRVIVSEPNEARRAICAALGAETLDPADGSVPSAVYTVTDGRGADIAIDAVGTSATLSDALQSTVLGGRVCLVGMAQPAISLDAYRISTDERVLVGSFTYPARTFRAAAQWVGEAPAALDLLISDVVSPEDADAVFEKLARSLDVPGKVLIRFAPDRAAGSREADADTASLLRGVEA